MRLLLDEQHDPEIAERLRREGFDVAAVADRRELRSLVDDQLLEIAASERRALVSEDVRDFSIVHRRWIDAGKRHYGVLLTARKRFPRSKRARRQLIAALRAFLRAHPADDDLRDQLSWL